MTGCAECHMAGHRMDCSSRAVNPDHYRGKLPGGHEVWDLFVHLGIAEAAALANVLKYVLRHREKNGAEDLKKARWYLDKLIDMTEEREKSRRDWGQP